MRKDTCLGGCYGVVWSFTRRDLGWRGKGRLKGSQRWSMFLGTLTQSSCDYFLTQSLYILSTKIKIILLIKNCRGISIP